MEWLMTDKCPPNPSRKKRLDDRLVQEGLAPNRSRAAAMLMSGKVLVNDVPQTKAGTMVPDAATIRLKEPDHPWVSRGGLKLEAALKAFSIVPTHWIVADIGASTGGFTHVALHYGAAKVYAVDVGHGQLAWALRSDERVVVLEKTNARALTNAHLPEPLDMLVCDASFIGLRTVLPAAMERLKDGGVLIALIKPQFEAGRSEVGKGGVVRDEAVHRRVCEEINNWLAHECGWSVMGMITSPITGPEGNKEFLIAAQKPAGIGNPTAL
jgi:23S rRNA (cytidine1920-2'-O)/16S rRNA (cytidine1409-2'-O)-methyltransferase